MKMASWSNCVLDFDSSGVPAFRTGENPCDLSGSSGSEFVVGRALSGEEVFGSTTGAPKEFPRSLKKFCACFVKIEKKVLWIVFPVFAGPVDAIPGFSGTGDVSTVAELNSEKRQKRAVIKRRFVPLSGLQSGPIECGSRDQI